VILNEAVAVEIIVPVIFWRVAFVIIITQMMTVLLISSGVEQKLSAVTYSYLWWVKY
jgi:hypothetical protein